MEEYRYNEIENYGQAFRLVQLHKGGYSDPIECSVFEGYIEDFVRTYDALSYTWGSCDNPCEITVDGFRMQITANLFNALQHIRSKTQDQVLWIDAICIDQKNNTEKNHQVGQMGRIYAKAEQVIIWLGEGTQETNFVMNTMKRVNEGRVDVGSDWRDKAQFWIDPQQQSSSLPYYRKGGLNVRLTRGMNSILSRSWFRRVWILQEVANARAARVVCGKFSVSAKTFAQFPSLIGLSSEQHWQSVLDIMPGLSREESWWRQDRRLHNLLRKFRRCEATDQRDRIYALLGISSDASKDCVLVPDYEKPLKNLVRETTSFLLSPMKQNVSLCLSLDWQLHAFMKNLDCLVIKVIKLAGGEWEETEIRDLIEGIEIDDIFNADAEGFTPIQRACLDGHTTVVKTLLGRGAGLEVGDQMEKTLLCLAAEGGYRDTVDLLIKSGANLEAKDKYGRTLVFLAVENEKEDAVSLLLEKGANYDTRDHYKQTPLFWASQRGLENMADLLLSKGASIEAADKTHQTPLIAAARYGYQNIVAMLLASGANIEARDIDQWTPLSWAALNGHASVVFALLEKRANIESRDIAGRTPLMLAVTKEKDWIVPILLKAGADLESQDKNNQTALSLAIQKKQPRICRQLLEGGASVNSLATGEVMALDQLMGAQERYKRLAKLPE